MLDPYEPVAVVPRSALARGERLRKLWLAGWGFGLLVTIGGAYLAGQAVAYRRAARDLAEARQEIERVRQEQTLVTASFVKAWENQQAGISLVTSWATYIKDRDEMVAYNKTHAPTPYAQRH